MKIQDLKIQNQQIARMLKRLAPSIACTLVYERDPYYTWDGDGPDPSDEGYEPFTVTVVVKTIEGGEEISGLDDLGGNYEKVDSRGRVSHPDEDIGGYLPQMLDKALEELLEELGEIVGGASVKTQVKKARAYIKRYMRESYRKQRKAAD